MSLIRLEKIRCYASPPLKSYFQLLNSKSKFGPSKVLHRRGFRSESSIQKENLAIYRNGLNSNAQKSSYIKALCEAFSLLPAKQISPFDQAKSNKWIQMEERKKAEQLYSNKSCEKCEKIRTTVKKFLRAKFETGKPDTEENNRKVSAEPISIRMHIYEDSVSPTAVQETLSTNDNIVCFGCEQETRQPSVRGPPILSPVCNNQNNGNINAAPLGEVFKKYPERLKKISRVNRPRSVLPKKNRVVEKDQNRETSVNEMQKPKSH